ncbi:MAG: hypothetical protein LBR45_04610 [Bacteroidales bacterium]|jgi:antitoxin component YwqK of YwqJK toxin-antitoxin module|nr:hypothetical protein [Bacteroidales bacterium]
MKKFLIISALFLTVVHLSAQDTTYFRHPDGTVSSKGILVKGQPNGLWTNYDQQGNVVSTAEWKNGELDGISTFYAPDNNTPPQLFTKTSEINYKNGKKNGISTYYNGEEKTTEPYRNGVRQGMQRIYRNDTLIQETPYNNDVENGLEKEYSTAPHRITTLTTYRRGLVTNRERINALNSKSQKQGLWKTLYSNNKIHTETTYKDGSINGYHKEYDTLGNLVLLEKYENGILVQDAPELAQIDIHTEYYANGNVKLKVGYKNGKPEGIMRIYDSITGKIKNGIIYKDGKKTGSGIIDDRGYIQGNWSDVYSNGAPKNKGKYVNGKRSGHWIFYDPLGKVMQEGDYRNGKEEGEWLWYFNDGNVRQRQNYENGLLNGLSEEYSDSGVITAKGNFIDGLEEGEWEYFLAGDNSDNNIRSNSNLRDSSNSSNAAGERMKGKYAAGERTGEWRHYWASKGNKMSFKGTFRDGLPDGRQIHYWENGIIRAEEFYRMGKRTGTWTKYDETGTPIVRIKHDKDEEEDRYNGVRTVRD